MSLKTRAVRYRCLLRAVPALMLVVAAAIVASPADSQAICNNGGQPSAGGCETTIVNLTAENDRVLIRVAGDDIGAVTCGPVGGLAFSLRFDSPGYKEKYALLLSALLTGRTVGLYMRGPDCQISYITLT